MPEEIDRNQIDSGSRGRSMHKGDVPDPMKRRYFVDEKGGPGLGFYVDAQVKAPAFRDLGARLVAGRADPNAIRDMAAVAHHRGWTAVTVHGDARFGVRSGSRPRRLGLKCVDMSRPNATVRTLSVASNRPPAGHGLIDKALARAAHAAMRRRSRSLKR